MKKWKKSSIELDTSFILILFKMFCKIFDFSCPLKHLQIVENT